MDDHRGEKSGIRALFKGHTERAYIFGKLEKLAHALLLLTAQSDRNRPIVERLEMSVLDSVRESVLLVSQQDHSPLVAVLLELVSLVRLCATAHIITQSNASILVGEYLELLGRLASPSLQGIVVRPEEFLVDGGQSAEEVQSIWQEMPHSLDELFRISPSATSENKGHRDQGHTKDVSVGRIKSQTIPKKTPSSVTERSQRVLSIVKAKGSVSIRDVSEVITDCSEKTLQRELLALVEKGVLKKEGERRWSTYRLA